MVTKEQLEQYYLVENLTREEIGKILGVSLSSVKRYLKKYNITKPQELLEKHYRKTSTTANLHPFTNGIINVYREVCPEGFRPGLSEDSLAKLRKPRLNITAEGREVWINNCKSRVGISLSEEHKNKISEYWKNNVHPNTGKERSPEVREKISLALTGREVGSIQLTKINSLTKAELETYLRDNKTIDYAAICKKLDLLDTQNNYQHITDKYIEEQVEFVKSGTSNFEQSVLDFIKSIYPGNIIQHEKTCLKGQELDIYVPEFKVAFEMNGIFWHRTDYKKTNTGFTLDLDSKGSKNPQYHFKKSKCAFDEGIRIIHIWEDQWYDERVRPTLEAIIKSALNASDENVIYARKCELKEISKEEYRVFCNQAHTQRSRDAAVKLGLFYEGQLVQVMSFDKARALNRAKDKEQKYDWELVRGCEAFNHCRVVGGVTKLFKYFVKKYQPETILCYSDFNLFFGKGYLACGFKLEGFTGPDKFYVEKGTFRRIQRSASKYREYMEKVVANKMFCCHGAGSLKFVWHHK